MDASSDYPLCYELASDIQRLSFEYFLKEANPENGLIADRNAQARIAAVGLAWRVLSRRCRARFHNAHRRRRADIGHASLLLERAAWAGARRHRL